METSQPPLQTRMWAQGYFVVLGMFQAPFSSRDPDQPTDSCADSGPVFQEHNPGSGEELELGFCDSSGLQWGHGQEPGAGGLALHWLHCPDLSFFLLTLRFSACQTCTSGASQDSVGTKMLEPTVTFPLPTSRFSHSSPCGLHSPKTVGTCCSGFWRGTLDVASPSRSSLPTPGWTWSTCLVGRAWHEQ